LKSKLLFFIFYSVDVQTTQRDRERCSEPILQNVFLDSQNKRRRKRSRCGDY
jgi:hypothetical protein